MDASAVCGKAGGEGIGYGLRAAARDGPARGVAGDGEHHAEGGREWGIERQCALGRFQRTRDRLCHARQPFARFCAGEKAAVVFSGSLTRAKQV